MKKYALALLLLTCQQQASAGPGYYLVSIYEDEGELALNYRSWLTTETGRPRLFSPSLSLAYMPNKRWYTEAGVSWFKREGKAIESSSWNWQNDYLLTQGQYSFDLALHTNLQRYNDRDRGVALEFGPAWQTDFGRLQVNANLFLERSYGSRQSNRMQMKYQWQSKYRWRPAFAFGLQGFGELGDWDDWAPLKKQSHRIGPVVFGSLGHALKYEAAFLTGKLAARPAHLFNLRLEYEF